MFIVRSMRYMLLLILNFVCMCACAVNLHFADSSQKRTHQYSINMVTWYCNAYRKRAILSNITSWAKITTKYFACRLSYTHQQTHKAQHTNSYHSKRRDAVFDKTLVSQSPLVQYIDHI